MDEQMDFWMDGIMDGQIEGQTNIRNDERVYGKKDGWINGLYEEWRLTDVWRRQTYLLTE